MNITRRRFIDLSTKAAAFTSVAGSIAATAYSKAVEPSKAASTNLTSGSKKKGLGFGVRNPLWPGILTTLRCKWCYTWMGPVPSDLPEGVDFIPMIRSRNANTEQIGEVAQQAKAHGITELLALNEPDAEKQDGMTVEDALAAWPLLMETGMRIGSPACVHPDNDWMMEFMAGVEERKLRVDFICVHSYGNPNPQAYLTRLGKINKLYDRPLWITEFGVGDWQAKSVEDNKHSAEDVLRYMEKVLPMLDNLDCLERYAWFPARPDSIPLATSALFDAEGALTPLGECYRDA